jgi:hypothetical protein
VGFGCFLHVLGGPGVVALRADHEGDDARHPADRGLGGEADNEKTVPAVTG